MVKLTDIQNNSELTSEEKTSYLLSLEIYNSGCLDVDSIFKYLMKKSIQEKYLI